MVNTKTLFLGTFVGRTLHDVRSGVIGTLTKLSIDEVHLAMEITLSDGSLHEFDGIHDAFGHASNAIFVSFGPSLRLVEGKNENKSFSEVTMPDSKEFDTQKMLAISLIGGKFTALRPNLDVVIKSVDLFEKDFTFHFKSVDGQALPSDYQSLTTDYQCLKPHGFSEPGMFVGHSTFSRTPHSVD